MLKKILSKKSLSEEQKQKIKESNTRFKKQFKYSISFVIAGVFIVLGAVLGLINSQGIPIGTMGQIIVVMSLAGILGAFMGDNIRAFDKELDSEIAEPENDFLSSFLKQSSYRKHFNPEVFEKLVILKLTKDEGLRKQLEQEIFTLIDTSIANIQSEKLALKVKPLLTKEKQTLLVMVAASLREAKIDWLKPSSAGALISKITGEMGAYVSEGAIADKLKLIPDAIDRRSK